MPLNCALLDLLLDTGYSFALCRLPDRSPVLYVQRYTQPDTFQQMSQLNGQSGFVMAPFRINAQHPIVLIRPDLIVKGEGNMIQYLNRLEKQVKKVADTALRVDAVAGSGTANGSVSENISVSENGSVTGSAPASKRNSKPNKMYIAAFELFKKALMAESCNKIVLSRTFKQPLGDDFSFGHLFGSACAAYPEAMVYVCYTPLTGLWLGSTPELLLAGNGHSWQTVALAGTMKLGDQKNQDLERVEWDAKNIKEQHIVTAYIEKQLCIKNLKTVISKPYTVRAGQVVHLRTDVTFEPENDLNVGDFLDFMHPTPAVCGYPKTEAYRLILAQEGYDRSYYSGFVGPLNMEKKTHVYVNLRCAKIEANQMTLFAGGGLMPDSELESEWDETESKLQTLLSLVGKKSNC